MTKEKERTKLLRDLVEARRPLSQIENDLADFDFDHDITLVTVYPENITTLLEKYLAREIDGNVVHQWASLLDGRDDVKSANNLVRDVIIDLANEDLFGTIDDNLAKDLISKLGLR